MMQCKICHIEFEPRSHASKFCPECARARKNEYQRQRRRELRYGEEGDKSKMHPCLYCGRPTKKAYCPLCISEGWDGVHKVTGKTNGWDKGKIREKYDLDEDLMRTSYHAIPEHQVKIDLNGFF